MTRKEKAEKIRHLRDVKKLSFGEIAKRLKMLRNNVRRSYYSQAYLNRPEPKPKIITPYPKPEKRNAECPHYTKCLNTASRKDSQTFGCATCEHKNLKAPAWFDYSTYNDTFEPHNVTNGLRYVRV